MTPSCAKRVAGNITVAAIKNTARGRRAASGTSQDRPREKLAHARGQARAGGPGLASRPSRAPGPDQRRWRCPWARYWCHSRSRPTSRRQRVRVAGTRRNAVVSRGYRIRPAPPSQARPSQCGNHMDRTVSRADETALRSRMRSRRGAARRERPQAERRDRGRRPIDRADDWSGHDQVVPAVAVDRDRRCPRRAGRESPAGAGARPRARHPPTTRAAAPRSAPARPAAPWKRHARRATAARRSARRSAC